MTSSADPVGSKAPGADPGSPRRWTVATAVAAFLALCLFGVSAATAQSREPVRGTQVDVELDANGGVPDIGVANSSTIATPHLFRAGSFVALDSAIDESEGTTSQFTPGAFTWEIHSANQSNGEGRAFSRTYARLNPNLRSGWMFSEHRGDVDPPTSSISTTVSTTEYQFTADVQLRLTVDVSRGAASVGETEVRLLDANSVPLQTQTVSNGTVEMTIPAGADYWLVIVAAQSLADPDLRIFDIANVDWRLDDFCQAPDGTWIC